MQKHESAFGKDPCRISKMVVQRNQISLGAGKSHVQGVPGFKRHIYWGAQLETSNPSEETN